MSEATVLRTALGQHRIGELLRSGQVSDPGVRLEIDSVEPIHRAFAPMVREQRWDVSELAIVTALQAVAYGHPVTILPVVLAARFQRKCLISHVSNPITDIAELRGKRVGVRSYTQTTGLWIRQHMLEDAGVEAADIEWITQNPAHVPEYVEPPYVHQTLETGLVDALRRGEIDAAILGNDLPSGDEFIPVIDDPSGRDRAWYEKHGYVPINHLVSVSTATLEAHPDAVFGAFELFTRAAAVAAAGEATPITIAGHDRLHDPLEEIAAACLAQGMLPRPITADEVLAPVQQLLATAS